MRGLRISPGAFSFWHTTHLGVTVYMSCSSQDLIRHLFGPHPKLIAEEWVQEKVTALLQGPLESLPVFLGTGPITMPGVVLKQPTLQAANLAASSKAVFI